MLYVICGHAVPLPRLTHELRSASSWPCFVSSWPSHFALPSRPTLPLYPPLQGVRPLPCRHEPAPAPRSTAASTRLKIRREPRSLGASRTRTKPWAARPPRLAARAAAHAQRTPQTSGTRPCCWPAARHVSRAWRSGCRVWGRRSGGWRARGTGSACSSGGRPRPAASTQQRANPGASVVENWSGPTLSDALGTPRAPSVPHSHRGKASSSCGA